MSPLNLLLCVLNVLVMIHRPLTSKYMLPSRIFTKNLRLFRVQFGNIFLKMDSVSKVVKGWSNPGMPSIYEKTRPNYNLDSVEFLLDKVGALQPHSGPEPFTIVELGAGTGKFTRAVLKVLEKRDVKNFKIICTEPLKEMCEMFKEMVPHVEILQCAASDLSGLSSNSANTILAAQCLHWFGMDKKSLNEIHRILKPNGALGIIWNLPDRSVSWIKNIEEILDPKFEGTKIPRPANHITFILLRNHGGFGNEGVDLTSYKYSVELDIEGVIERYKGNIVVSSAPDEEKQRILLAIEQEMKSNPDTKDKQKYNHVHAIKMYWFQKI